MGKIPSPDFVQRRYSTVKQKRALSGVLALVLALSLLPRPPGPGGWDGNLQRQNIQHRLYHLAAGRFRLGEHRSGDLHTMAGSGCLVTSIAILMCHSGAYDPSTFNPGVFRDWLDSKGYTDSVQTAPKTHCSPLGASPPLLLPGSTLSIKPFSPSPRRWPTWSPRSTIFSTAATMSSPG